MTIKLDKNPGITRSIMWIVLITFTAGCTTMQPVHGTDAASYSAQIEVGDKIRITRTDLSTVEFEITQIANDGIGGDGTFVAWSEIEQIETVHGNTAATVAILALATIALAVAVAAAAGPGIGAFSLQ